MGFITEIFIGTSCEEYFLRKSTVKIPFEGFSFTSNCNFSLEVLARR